MPTNALREENGKMVGIIIPDPHTQNTDYKLVDYTQTIDITGLTEINFLNSSYNSKKYSCINK